MKLTMEKWIKTNKIHLWVWSIFICYETIVIGILFKLFGSPLTYFAHYAVIIPLFYLHSDIAMPWAFRVKEQIILRAPFIVLIQIVIYVLLHYLTDLFLISTKIIEVKGDYKLSSLFILRNLYRGFFFMGFSTGYYFLRTYIKERKKTADLEKEQLNAIIKHQNIEQELFKAQNAFLKAQINPHFLFNTLDFIYHKVSISSPEAAEAVISLAEMMRYAITSDEKGGEIKLEDEMEQAHNLLNLFKLRKKQPLFLELDFAANTHHIKFIPLVLLTLTENMFKHGQVHDVAHVASVKVYIEANTLCMETDNLSQPQKSNRSHTGLLNIKNRLIYAYGEDISFNYHTDTNNHFKLKLGIPLANLNGNG